MKWQVINLSIKKISSKVYSSHNSCGTLELVHILLYTLLVEKYDPGIILISSILTVRISPDKCSPTCSFGRACTGRMDGLTHFT